MIILMYPVAGSQIPLVSSVADTWIHRPPRVQPHSTSGTDHSLTHPTDPQKLALNIQ